MNNFYYFYYELRAMLNNWYEYIWCGEEKGQKGISFDTWNEKKNGLNFLNSTVFTSSVASNRVIHFYLVNSISYHF